MPSYKTKALVLSPLLLICMQSHTAQLHQKDCAGAPVYTTASLEARDAADVALNGKPACQRIPHYFDQMIFTGTATRVLSSDGRAMLNGECSKTELQTVTIKVKQIFFGQPPQTLTIQAGDINGFYFKTNGTYLVVGHQRPDGTFALNRVATEAVADAKDDLAYLRSMPNRSPAADLFGGVYTVYAPPHDNVIPIGDLRTEGLKLSIEGHSQIETTTGRYGQFKLTGLAPGRYTIRLNTDLPTESARVQTVDIAPRGCAEINFYVVKPFPTKTPEKKR